MTHYLRLGRSRQRTLAVGLVAATALALGGCSSAHNEAAQTPGAAAATGSNAKATAVPEKSKPGGASKAAIPSKSKLPKQPRGVSTKRAKDPVAPKTVKQVIRNGHKPHPTVRVKGGAKPFTKAVVYTDGLTLKITKMTQAKITGEGPGVFPGQPVTNFYVSLTNGTKKKLTIGVVVVTVTYGSPARLARAVYGPKSKDFSGPVKAGGVVNAVYGFSVPTADLAHVQMTVDIDGSHELATFTGSVK